MKSVSILLFAVTLAGCGEEENITSENVFWPPFEENTQATNYGYMVDSAVEGLRYVSGTHYGTTDTEGKFGYILGEKIQFYVGNVKVGSLVTPDQKLTPFEIANNDSSAALNIARFLQTLDDDAAPNNGIKITETVHHVARNKSIDFSELTWPDNSDLTNNHPGLVNLMYELTSVTSSGPRELVQKYDAYYHYSQTLDVMIDDLQAEIDNLGQQTSCDDASQCKYIQLETKYLSYCPPLGPLIIYSEKDLDQSRVDSLSAERENLISIKSQIKNSAYTDDNTTGLCMRVDNPAPLTCSISNHCETLSP